MKPVARGVNATKFRVHGDAKPELIHRMGTFCSYCERHVNPHDLHVEHIYPQKSHPKRAQKWRNFLLACSTCNTYKDKHLGHGKQTGLLKHYAWPHIDNTFRAYIYDASGTVEVSATISADGYAIALNARNMVGLMRTPTAADAYDDLGIAYDGIKTRQELWGIAETALLAYLDNPSEYQIAAAINQARTTGHFSIWMEVFRDYTDVRKQLIQVMQADGACFDPITTEPTTRGRI